MKVLVIDREPPIYPQQGNALIGLEIFARLRHHDLTLIAPVRLEELDKVEEQLSGTFRRVKLVPRRDWTPAIAGFVESRLARRARWLPGLDLSAAGAVADEVQRAARDDDFDVLHVRQLPMAGYARFAPGIPRLLELVDSESLGARRAIPRNPRTKLRTKLARWSEERAMRGFQVITTVAEADAAELRRLAPSARVEVVPNGVDADRFAAPVGGRRDPATLTFVGAMSFPPNIAAVQYLARDIFPLVRRRRADARLKIVGRNPAPSVQALAAAPGIDVTGEVPDVRPYLVTTTVFVAPMVSGSGIKNKVLEALAASCPVVATSLAADGLPVRDGEHLLIADNPAGFADAVLELLRRRDRAAAIGRAGSALVAEGFSWERCASRYESLYAELAAAPSPTG